MVVAISERLTPFDLRCFHAPAFTIKLADQRRPPDCSIFSNFSYYSIANGPLLGLTRVGAWSVWPDMGSAEPNPYARAAIARDGIVPLGVAEGLAFAAETDDAGKALSGGCTYRLAGPMPATRTWTLTLTTTEGHLVENPAKRYGFTAQEILRDADGRFDIMIGPSARPGNWLPTGNLARFALVLKLYDTPLTATGTALKTAVLPKITRQGCP
jgi:hypothetical protein